MSSHITEQNEMTVYRAGSNAASLALSRVRGSVTKPQFTAVSPSGTVVWRDEDENGFPAGGTFVLSGSGNRTATYTPNNRSQIVQVKATDAVNTVSRQITIFGTLPLYAQFGYKVELDVETKIKYAKDRTPYFREDGLPEISWVFEFNNRAKEDVSELMQFWANHRKVLPFYLVDPELNLLNQVFFTSSWTSSPLGGNRNNMAASFKGQYDGLSYTESI